MHGILKYMTLSPDVVTVVKIVCKRIQHKTILRYYYSKLQFLPHHLEVFQ